MGIAYTTITDEEIPIQVNVDLVNYRVERYFHRRFLPLLQRRPMNELKAIANALKTTKELMLKVNSLRERAGLSAIE